MTTAERTTDKKTGRRTYTYPPTGEELISVTTVLGDTEGKAWLAPWSARIAAEFAVDNIAMLARLIETEGRDAAVDLVKQQSELIRDVKRDAGSHVHHWVEALILWAASPEGTGPDIAFPLLPDQLVYADYDGAPLEDVTEAMVTGFTNWVADFRPQFEAAEMTVFSVKLGVAGTLDIIAILHGVAIGKAGRLVAAPGKTLTCCIDVKTGRHLSVTWREQVAMYRRCDECLLPMGEMARMPPTDCAMVLHLRPEHERGYRLMLVSGDDDQAAYESFLSALNVSAERTRARPKPGKVVYALRADGTMPQPRLADMDGEGYGRALSPLIKAGITDLEQVAAMKAGDLLATKGIKGGVLAHVRRMLADHGLHLAGEAA